MDQYREAVRRLGGATIGSILGDFAQEGGPTRFADDQRITICGIVTSSKTKTTRNNSLMAYVTVEDDTASIELLCFARVLESCGPYLKENQAVVVKGRLSVREESAPDPLRQRVSLSAAGAPAAEGAGRESAGSGAVPEVPQPGPPQRAPHEAGVPDVSRQRRCEDGDGGHPQGLRHPCKPPRGPAAGGPGDVGRGQCGGEIERNARVQKDTGVFHSQAPFQLQDQLHNPGAQGQAGGLDGPEHWPFTAGDGDCAGPEEKDQGQSCRPRCQQPAAPPARSSQRNSRPARRGRPRRASSSIRSEARESLLISQNGPTGRGAGTRRPGGAPSPPLLTGPRPRARRTSGPA